MKIRFVFIVFILVSVALGGCGSAVQPMSILPTTILPTSTAKLTETSQPATATIVPSPLPTSTVAPDATLTSIAASQPIRRTPPTLMLHRSSLSFDAVQFLKEFIAVLKQNDMQVITYQEINKNPEITATKQGKLFIISIDDIYLRYPIHQDILEMIALLRDAGYPAVLGIVTEDTYAYPETVQTLKELSAAGWELASHTDRHSNLGVMEKTAPRYVYTEVQTSVDKIQSATGVRTHTLILPEGQMVNDPRFIKRAGIIWIVGINGGVTYDIRKEMVYIGREGPAGTAQQTFRAMMNRFDP